MRILSLILALSLISSASYGTTVTTSDGTVCDFSTTIHNADGTVTYPAALHNCVGKLVQDNAAQKQSIADLNKAADLYKLTIQTDEQRIQNWITTSVNLEKRVEATANMETKNEWLYFGLGVLATSAAAYTFAKATGH
jgi:hypothetical protein